MASPYQDRGSKNVVTIVIGILALVLAWFSFKSLFQPGIALAMIWSLYAAEQLFQVGTPVLLKFGAVINFAFVAVTALAVLNALRVGRYRGRRLPPEAWWCGGLLAFAAFSFFWSVSPGDTVRILQTSLPYIVAFVLIAPLCATDQEQLSLAVNTTVFLGAIILVGHGLSNYGRRSLVLAYVGGQDVESNPLAVATYAGYVSICALFSIYGRKFSPLIAIKAVVFVLGAFIIIKSGSRGQLAALAAVSFLWLPIIARATLKRSTILAMLGAIVIVCAALYTVDQLRNTGRWRTGQFEVATSGRLEMITGMLYYWGDAGPFAWLLGLGNSSAFKIVGFYPHNVPVEVLTEEGLIGFLMYLAFSLSVLNRGGRTMFIKDLKVESRVNLGILMAIFCFEGILTLKQGSLMGNSGWIGIGITIGWVASRFHRTAKKNQTHRLNASYYQQGHMQPATVGQRTPN